MVLIAGAFLPIQAGLNSRLGKAGESPVHASTISFVVGAVALILYLVVTKQTVSWSVIKAAPTYLWIGGILGAFYVTVIILAFPKIRTRLNFWISSCRTNDFFCFIRTFQCTRSATTTYKCR